MLTKMISRIFLQTKIRHVFLIIMVTVISHGWLFLVDGLYYDSIVMLTHSLVLDGRPDLVLRTLFESRVLSHVLYRIIISNFDNFVLAFKMVGFFSILTIGLSIYAVLTLLKLKDSVRVYASLFYITYPLYAMAVDASFALYLLDTALFSVATLISLFPYFFYLNKRAKFLMNFVSSLMFLLSFGTGSLLVFYNIALLLRFIAFYTNDKKRFMTPARLSQFVLYWIRQDFSYFLLPILYWFWVRVILQPDSTMGYFAEYHTIDWRNILNINLWRWFHGEGIVKAITNINSRLVTVLFAVFSLVFAILVWLAISFPRQFVALCELTADRIGFTAIALQIKGAPAFLGQRSDKGMKYLFPFSVILFVLAAFPYIALGKYPFFEYYEMRHGLLLGFSIAIFFAFLSPYCRIVVLLVLSICVFNVISNYISYQTAWVKMRSVMLNVKHNENISSTTMIEVIDNYPIDSDHSSNFGYDFDYQWTALFRLALSPNNWPIAENPKKWKTPSMRENFLSYMHMSHYQVDDSPRHTLVISKSPYVQMMSSWQIAFNYWSYRWANNQDTRGIEKWLEQFVVVKLENRP